MKNMKSNHQKKFTTGFTLIELLITLAVFSILMGSIFSFFNSQRDTYLAEDLKLERDQNLRMAAETISRELGLAGSDASAPVFVDHLPQWAPPAYVPDYPLSVTLDANPKITLGDGDLPDVLTFACAVPTTTNPTSLSQDSDGTSITVSLSAGNSEEQYKPGDILAVGCIPEYASVAAVDGNVLTVDADPEASGSQPLSMEHAAGSPVKEISIVSYAVFNDDNDPECKRHEAARPLLKRKVNASGFYPVAENISQMKVSQPESGVLQVSLTGSPDRNNLGGMRTGKRTLAARVSLRNDLAAGFATDCIKPASPDGLVLEEGLDESYPCQILVSWDAVTEDATGNSLEEAGCPVTGYRIYFDSVSGAFGNFADVSPGETSGVVLDVSAILSSEFYVCVAAENSGGFGEKSPETAITDVTGPEKPTGVSASSAGLDKILLLWDENSECDLAGYCVYRKKNAGAFLRITGLIPSGSDSYLDTGLDAGDYTYKLEAVDFGFNESELSDAVAVELP